MTVPGSKSITNRALIAAALADGSSELVGALHSDDTRYMAAALNALGVIVESNEAKASFRIEGGGGTFTAPEADLFVGNSGTTMRSPPPFRSDMAATGLMACPACGCARSHR